MAGKVADILRWQTDCMPHFAIIAELEMAQGTINGVLCVIMQYRTLDELHAQQGQAHEADKQELAQSGNLAVHLGAQR